MHFYCTLKHEDNPSESNRQTQLRIKRGSTNKQNWASLKSRKKGRASATMELNYGENFLRSLCFDGYMLQVKCHVLNVKCHSLHVIKRIALFLSTYLLLCKFFDNLTEFTLYAEAPSISGCYARSPTFLSHVPRVTFSARRKLVESPHWVGKTFHVMLCIMYFCQKFLHTFCIQNLCNRPWNLKEGCLLCTHRSLIRWWWTTKTDKIMASPSTEMANPAHFITY
jgi:hypothetical protein